jgi:conjugal transfer pilus assembly protein TrbC
MFRIFLPLLLACSLQALEVLPPNEEAALEALKNSLKAELKLDEVQQLLMPSGKQCFSGMEEPEESSPKVFISFSVPESVWISLSPEMEECGGSFVLRGLPKNSFQELASKVLKLRQSGVRAPLLISPEDFEKHQIKKVPTFIFYEEGEVFKLSGSVSFRYALEKFLSGGACGS